MPFPTTLEDIKTYIAGLSSFPVDRTTQVFYGFTDYTGSIYVVFSDLKTDTEYTTCGPAYYTTNFNIHVFHTSNASALSVSRQIDPLFAGQAVTPKTMGCWLETIQVVQEDKYRFHAVMSFRLMERA